MFRLVILLLAAVASLTACQSPKRSCCCGSPPALQGATVHAGSVFDLGAQWQDDNGTPFPMASLAGHPVVIGMVFTSCQGVCLITRDQMKAVEASLPSSIRDQTTFVLVTLDPTHDTPPVLRQYRLENGFAAKRWRLLRGSPAATGLLANWLGVTYGRDDSGRFKHSTRITVLDATGKITFAEEGPHADLTKVVAAVR